MLNYVLVIESKNVETVLYCNQVPVLSLTNAYDGLLTRKLNGWLHEGANQISLGIIRVGEKCMNERDVGVANDAESGSEDCFVTGAVYSIEEADAEAKSAIGVARYEWRSKHASQALPFCDQFDLDVGVGEIRSEWDKFEGIDTLSVTEKKQIIALGKRYFRALLDNDKTELLDLLKHKSTRLNTCCHRDFESDILQRASLEKLERNQLECMNRLDAEHFRYVSAMKGRSIVVLGDLMHKALQDSKQQWPEWPFCVAKYDGEWVIVN